MDVIGKSPGDAFLQQWVSENLLDLNVNVPTEMIGLSHPSTTEMYQSGTDTEFLDILQNEPSQSLTELVPPGTDYGSTVTELVSNISTPLNDDYQTHFSPTSTLNSISTNLEIGQLFSYHDYISNDESMSDNFSKTIFQQSSQNLGNMFAQFK